MPEKVVGSKKKKEQVEKFFEKRELREARLPHYVAPDHRFASGPSNNYPSPAIVPQRPS